MIVPTSDSIKELNECLLDNHKHSDHKNSASQKRMDFVVSVVRNSSERSFLRRRSYSDPLPIKSVYEESFKSLEEFLAKDTSSFGSLESTTCRSITHSIFKGVDEARLLIRHMPNENVFSEPAKKLFKCISDKIKRGECSQENSTTISVVNFIFKLSEQKNSILEVLKSLLENNDKEKALKEALCEIQVLSAHLMSLKNRAKDTQPLCVVLDEATALLKRIAATFVCCKSFFIST